MLLPILVSLVDWDLSIAINYYKMVLTLPQLLLTIRIILATGIFIAFILAILYLGPALLKRYGK
jgi:hypothetical protein